MRIGKRLLTLLALMALSLAFSGESSAQTRETTILKPLRYRVTLPGDNLYRISRRFGVPMDRLLSAEVNPRLASRKNPKFLYLGETITIPVYVNWTVPASAVFPSDKVVLSAQKLNDLEKTVLAHNARIADLTDENTKLKNAGTKSLNNAILFSLVSLFVAAVVLFLVYPFRNVSLSRDNSSPSPLSFENSSPEDILALLRTAKGSTLVAVNKLAITEDESKNPVRLTNLDKYLQNPKRTSFADMRVDNWDSAKVSQQVDGLAPEA